MEKSAGVIGRGMGKTAREVNALLREYGYLEGSPNDYSLTEKGKQYGSEQYHHRGTGGYAFYNPEWTTRTWDERIVSALADDMAAGPSAVKASTEPEPGGEVKSEDDPKRPPWAAVALVGGAAVALVGGVVVATNPRVHRWVGENVTPRAQKAWRTLTGRGPVGEGADHDDALSGVVDPAEAPAKGAISESCGVAIVEQHTRPRPRPYLPATPDEA